jgi:hypothetical protein
MTRGILLVATENPYYGKMAYNLAVSIRAVDPEVQIAVITSGAGLSHLREPQRKVFDKVITCSSAAGVSAKLWLYKLTPFDKTLYMDADNIWLPKRKPSDLLNELDGVEFTAITEGKYNADTGEADLSDKYLLWGDMAETAKAHELTGELYQWRSEIMYFEKTEKVEQLFDYAVEVFNDPGVKVREFGQSPPDEFAFMVAAAIVGIKPHRYKWQPVYWSYLSGNFGANGEVMERYWMLSTGGNSISKKAEKLYNDVVTAAHYKLRMQSLFKLQPKRRVIKERRYF